MNPIDIGIISYGRLKFLKACIESILNSTSIPFNLYVANNYSIQEPEIEDYLLRLFETGVIKGVILIKKNIFSGAIDLLYSHFLKSNPFCVTDSDVTLPEVDYCWLDYMSKIVMKDKWAYLNIRSSLCNIGSTDEEVRYRLNREIKRESIIASYNNYVKYEPCSRIGLYHYTGVHFQVINRFFYEKYLRRHKQFRFDHMLWRYARRKRYLYGSLLDDCIHLGNLTREFYPFYIKDEKYEDYIQQHNLSNVDGVVYTLHSKG